jgi:signal peptidase II
MSERTRRLLLTALVVAFVLAVDLWTKDWVWRELREGRAVEVIPGIFYLRFGFNTGSAFSFLRDAAWGRTFFITITFAAVLYMVWLATSMPTVRRYGFVAIGMIMGGALGNLHDRFVRIMKVPFKGQWVERYGVVDFLQFYYPWDPEHYWPIFNVADSALVCGVVLLVLYMRFHGEVVAVADGGAGKTSSVADAPA